MFLKVMLRIMVKLDGGRFGMIGGDGSRSGRFFFACLKDAEEIFYEQYYSMVTVHISQRELSPELITGISYTGVTLLLPPVARMQLL